MLTHNGVPLSEALTALRKAVKLARQQRHLSVREAAKEIGMAYPDLSRFETGKSDPKFSTIQKLVAWLEDDPYA